MNTTTVYTALTLAEAMKMCQLLLESDIDFAYDALENTITFTTTFTFVLHLEQRLAALKTLAA